MKKILLISDTQVTVKRRANRVILQLPEEYSKLQLTAQTLNTKIKSMQASLRFYIATSIFKFLDKDLSRSMLPEFDNAVAAIIKHCGTTIDLYSNSQTKSSEHGLMLFKNHDQSSYSLVLLFIDAGARKALLPYLRANCPDFTVLKLKLAGPIFKGVQVVFLRCG